MEGRVHSIQTLGTLDGPGVRFVVFMQGCRLRCGCCHNPDTWAETGGTLYTPEALVGRAARYKAYFGTEGGITVSGGEPLLQAEFVAELFALCHMQGINTCLDTAGSAPAENVLPLLRHTDRVLLDIKYTTDALYRRHVGCSLNVPLSFLRTLGKLGIPTTLRQVIIPGLNDTPENIRALAALVRENPCVEKTELLPFRKLCITKYEMMGIPFPFAEYDTPGSARMRVLERLLAEYTEKRV